MVGKVGDTDKQGQADRLQQVSFQNVFGFLNFESLGTILNHLDVILNHLIKLDITLDVMVFQVVSAVVEEVLQPKQNGLKAKTN